MIRFVVLLVLALSVAVRAPLARAENPSLADARKAVDEIRYDDARELLVQALKQGGNRPEELVEIYRLSGATAAVLGPTELAEQYYRRMLALAPDATLPPDASPRLRDPFVAAQAYMAAQQRFDVRATRTANGIAVRIVDPLGMAVAVATLERGELRGKQPVVPAGAAVASTPPGDTPVGIAAHVLDDVGDTVVVLDEHGNFLRVIPLPARPLVDAAATPRTPFYKRWITYAIPAVLFAGASAVLFVDARRAHDRLDAILVNDSMHYYDEAETERRRWRGHTIFGWVGTGVALGFTATAIVMATRPAPVRATTSQLRLTPSIGPDLAGLQLHANF